MSSNKKLMDQRLSVAGLTVVKRASIEKLAARLDKEETTRRDAEKTLIGLREKIAELRDKLETKSSEADMLKQKVREAEITIKDLERALLYRDRRIGFLELELRNAVQTELSRLFSTTSAAGTTS